jgi:plastocyanin domain-containing protein
MKGMNKTALIIITLGLLVFLGIIFTGGPAPQDAINGSVSVQNVNIRDGIQYINIIAKGGYTPSVTQAQSGIPTKLIVETNNTFDCSASLVVRSADFQEVLPKTGETEIDLGTPNKGDTYEGLCSMGMYSFKVDFI